MEPLGALSGAAGGMADAVAGIIEQRMRQAQLANQIEDSKARIAETARANQADETYRNQQLEQTGAYQTGQLINAAANSRRVAATEASKETLGQLKTLPTGTIFTPERRADMLAKGALPEQFAGYQPPTMGMSTPTGEVGPAEGGYKTVGLQSELDKANKLPTENLAAHQLAVQRILAKPQATWTPDEAALVQGQREWNKVAGEQAAQRLNVSINATNTRRGDTETDRAITHESDQVQKKIDTLHFPQAAKLIDTLNQPGGESDVIAIPEFLTAMAGGMGTGLRMTQAELDLIQHARPGTENIAMKLNNLAGTYRALTDDQRAQMVKLVRSVATREAELSDRYTLAMAKINQAGNAKEARDIRNKMNEQETQLYRDEIGLPGATKPAVGGAGDDDLVNRLNQRRQRQ